MDRCTGRCNISEILVQMALNTKQSVNLLFGQKIFNKADYNSIARIHQSFSESSW